jgi:hypothetical protein
MRLPPLKLHSFKRPVEVHFDFVDQILQRLTELRAPPQRQ